MAKHKIIDADPALLADAIKLASIAALDAIKPDDGTVPNYDLVRVEINGKVPAIIKIIENQGLCVTNFTNIYYIHAPDDRWKGKNRARQCDAMASSLRKQGFKAVVYSLFDK